MSDADGPGPDPAADPRPHSRPAPRPDDPPDDPSDDPSDDPPDVLPPPPANAWHNRVPSPFGPSPEGTPLGRALGAATVWGGAFGGFLGSAAVWSTPPADLVAHLVALVLGATLLAAPLTWSLTRRRRLTFSLLVLVALPLFLLSGLLVDTALRTG